MRNDVRIEIRISKDLKDKFSAFCEGQGVTVSNKLKSMIMAELLADLARLSPKGNIPKNNPLEKPSLPPKIHSETLQATTLHETIETPINPVKTQNNTNPLLDFIDDETEVNFTVNKNSIVQSAINASKKRNFSKKKRK